MKLAPLSCLLPAMLLGACSFIVDSKVKDLEPGPDFDPAECAVWGRVFLERPGDLNIVPDDSTLNGSGYLELYLYGPTETTGELRMMTLTGEDIDFADPHYYCIRHEDSNGFTEGLFTGVLMDTLTEPWTGNAYPYKAIMTDPFLYQLLIPYRAGLTTYMDLTDLFWDGTPGARVDVPLKVRISKLEGNLLFSEAFPGETRSGVSPRICAYAWTDTGMDDRYVHRSYIGSRVIDMPDHAPAAGNTYTFDFNVAALPGQEFAVFIVYVEGRAVFPPEDPCGIGGTPGDNRSCFMKNVTMDPAAIGGVMSDPDPYVVEPATDTCYFPD